MIKKYTSINLIPVPQASLSEASGQVFHWTNITLIHTNQSTSTSALLWAMHIDEGSVIHISGKTVFRNKLINSLQRSIFPCFKFTFGSSTQAITLSLHPINQFLSHKHGTLPNSHSLDSPLHYLSKNQIDHSVYFNLDLLLDNDSSSVASHTTSTRFILQSPSSRPPIGGSDDDLSNSLIPQYFE